MVMMCAAVVVVDVAVDVALWSVCSLRSFVDLRNTYMLVRVCVRVCRGDLHCVYSAACVTLLCVFVAQSMFVVCVVVACACVVY